MFPTEASLPAPSGYVNDFASALKPETVSRVEAMASMLQKNTTIEMAVVTVPSLEGQTVEDYAVKLFEKWKIGNRKRDNGLLFLIAPVEHKARIEVGYGLEGILNDAKATRILRNNFVPYAKEGNISEGVEETTTTLYKILSGDEKGEPAQRKKSGQNPVVTFLIILILIYLAVRHPWLLLFFAGSGRSGGSSGGFGGGGGFGGFGGGSSGGGGGSSSW